MYILIIGCKELKFWEVSYKSFGRIGTPRHVGWKPFFYTNNSQLFYYVIPSRCQCFYGPSCSANITDPCATYQLPPPLPKVFSTFYTTTVTNCKNKACTTVTNIGEMLQNATAGEQRIDEIGISWTTRFIFPFQYIENDDYIQVHILVREFKYRKACTL